MAIQTIQIAEISDNTGSTAVLSISYDDATMLVTSAQCVNSMTTVVNITLTRSDGKSYSLTCNANSTLTHNFQKNNTITLARLSSKLDGCNVEMW